MEEQRIKKRALPESYVLEGKYKIGQVIGEGGFGITYSGTRLSDHLRVAVKEYFPAQCAAREDGYADSELHIFCGEKSLQFEKGLAYFKHEAEILKKYSYLDGMVTVLDTCETNKTAYIVMEFVEGITLAQYIRENGVFSYDELIDLMTPIIKSLAQIHRQGVIHRDISPENIQIGLDDRFYLLDFGAAKKFDQNSPQNTVIFKHGYAPPEQYTGDGRQGPWTDVYALASTIYTALSGEALADAVVRMQAEDEDSCCDKLSGITDWQRDALKKGLALKPSERYQNMEAFLTALAVRPALDEQRTQFVSTVHSPDEPDDKRKRTGLYVALIVCILVIVEIAGMAVVKWLNKRDIQSVMGRENVSQDTRAADDSTAQITEAGKNGDHGADAQSGRAASATENVKKDNAAASTEKAAKDSTVASTEKAAKDNEASSTEKTTNETASGGQGYNSTEAGSGYNDSTDPGTYDDEAAVASYGSDTELPADTSADTESSIEPETSTEPDSAEPDTEPDTMAAGSKAGNKDSESKKYNMISTPDDDTESDTKSDKYNMIGGSE